MDRKWAEIFRTIVGVKNYLMVIKLKQLLDDAIYWIEDNTFNSEELIIRLKHSLESIHCFAAGNRRHSRLIGIFDNGKIIQ